MSILNKSNVGFVNSEWNKKFRELVTHKHRELMFGDKSLIVYRIRPNEQCDWKTYTLRLLDDTEDNLYDFLLNHFKEKAAMLGTNIFNVDFSIDEMFTKEGYGITR